NGESRRALGDDAILRPARPGRIALAVPVGIGRVSVLETARVLPGPEVVPAGEHSQSDQLIVELVPDRDPRRRMRVLLECHPLDRKPRPPADARGGVAVAL